MRASKPLTITLPAAMAAKVKARVASGDYASESEVIRDGLRALEREDQLHQAETEHWLQTEGRKRAREHAAGKMKTIPAAEMRTRLEAHMKRRRAKAK